MMCVLKIVPFSEFTIYKLDFFYLTFKTVCVLHSFKLSGNFHFSFQSNHSLWAVLQSPQALLACHPSGLGLEDFCPQATASLLSLVNTGPFCKTAMLLLACCLWLLFELGCDRLL